MMSPTVAPLPTGSLGGVSEARSMLVLKSQSGQFRRCYSEGKDSVMSLGNGGHYSLFINTCPVANGE